MGVCSVFVLVLAALTMVTPRKVHAGSVCCVCKQTIKKGESRQINSPTGQKKQLSSLLFKYGDVDIVEGVICRNCERRLTNIDKSVAEFRKLCHDKMNLLSSKRGLTDITNTQDIKKRHAPKQLFSPCLSNTIEEESETVSDCLLWNEPVFTTPVSKRKEVTISPVPTDDSFVIIKQSVGFKTPIAIRKKEEMPCTSTPVVAAHKDLSLELSPMVVATPGQNLEPDSKHNDHPYSRNDSCDEKNKKPKLHKSRLAKQHDKSVSIVCDSFSTRETDDFLSDMELSDILGQLPHRSRQQLVHCLLKHEKMKSAIENTILAEISKGCDFLKNRKHGKVSVLMSKDYVELKNFNWDEILEEIKSQHPFLLRLFLSVLLPETLTENQKAIKAAEIIPRLGMAYAILAQGRNSALSKVQRVLSTVLFDHICDQKVFDRLQPLGVCLSYSGGLQLLDNFAGHFNSDVIDALRSGHRIRLVGDNINWKTGVHDERKDHHGKMHHAFGSAVIVQNTCFQHLSNVKPQVSVRNLETGMFLPSEQECETLLKDFAVTILRTAARHIPYFEQFVSVVPNSLWGEAPDGLNLKNKVIPLPVLHYNEQKYDEVVQIMDYYENFLDQCYSAAGLDIIGRRIQIGGDQLTRDRFSGAKRLRAGGLNPSERLEHLSPITFEMFHLLMNYVQLMFKQLYKDSSTAEIGTMKCEATRILRSSVSTNVNEHYDADRDFIVSFVDCYIVEAVLHHFGMADVLSVPTKNQPPPTWKSKSEKQSWLMQVFGDIVRSYVWAKEDKSKLTEETDLEVEGVVVPVKLANGNIMQLMVKKQPKEPDMVKSYSHLVLELGLQFKSLLSLCKSPNRNRGLALLKTTMIHFKANNQCSKYASEILRLLVHQYCVLSEKEANEEFYDMFVNSSGKIDSHIPCDLKMEHIVRNVKTNIKHMFSNKTDKNITTRTSALPTIKDISEKYDSATGVIIRSKRHTNLESLHDEREMLKDIHKLIPFDIQSGRKHNSFPKVPNQMNSLLEVNQFRMWISNQTYKYATDLGN